MFVTWIRNKGNAWVTLEISKSGHNWTSEKTEKNSHRDLNRNTNFNINIKVFQELKKENKQQIKTKRAFLVKS